ncbi:phage tail tube protein [Lysinibacter cavernae]|uniref:Uncharacterized protein n=1 Tax=Lysinibacter cavernae TaxID=1640652 RepID=A0A7X5TTX5_9MICO|nr:hypothetical protein [Lysinibacter cavernae]NIH53753.1 hypothetical protein [Lysinibacter cavernae]
MAINDNALVVPGSGTLFIAPKNTPMPATGLSAFTLTGTAPEGWTNIGHTSTSETFAFAKEGGEATNLPTWIKSIARTVYSAVSWTLTGTSLQVDKTVFDLAFNGWLNDTNKSYVVPSAIKGKEVALFLLATDATGGLGFYMPNASTSLGEAPTIDVENFFGVQIVASIGSADASAIPAGPDGTPGLMEVFGPVAFEEVAPVQA